MRAHPPVLCHALTPCPATRCAWSEQQQQGWWPHSTRLPELPAQRVVCVHETLGQAGLKVTESSRPECPEVRAALLSGHLLAPASSPGLPFPFITFGGGGFSRRAVTLVILTSPLRGVSLKFRGECFCSWNESGKTSSKVLCTG